MADTYVELTATYDSRTWHRAQNSNKHVTHPKKPTHLSQATKIKLSHVSTKGSAATACSTGCPLTPAPSPAAPTRPTATAFKYPVLLNMFLTPCCGEAVIETADVINAEQRSNNGVTNAPQSISFDRVQDGMVHQPAGNRLPATPRSQQDKREKDWYCKDNAGCWFAKNQTKSSANSYR